MDAPLEAAREARFPKWAAAITDPNAFQQEQARLGRVWTFLGWTHDVAKDGDWFTAELGGRSVFVQRFGNQLKGFENRCAHRFYPLRTAEKGNGKIKCGYHHWTYNREGRVVHIPRCEQFFGVTVEEMNARIAPIEVATCGSLVFGRFQHPHDQETLEQYLDEGAPILKALCTIKSPPRMHRIPIEANWKLCYHITMDDYHPPAVHPKTLGQWGYLARDAIRYFRFGSHNAYFLEADEDALQRMIRECDAGTHRPTHYRIFQFFPNLLIAVFRAQYHVPGRVDRHWFVSVQHFHPVSPERTMLRSWYYRSPFDLSRGPLDRFYKAFSEPVRNLIVGHMVRKIHGEDNGVVEQLQRFASQQGGWPRLGYAEERIRWFEEAYAKATAD